MIKIKKWAGRDMNLTILMGVTLVILIWSGMAFGQSMYSMRNIQSMTFQIPEFGFLALAMMLSNMIGGIDLSIIANAKYCGYYDSVCAEWPMVLWDRGSGKSCAGTYFRRFVQLVVWIV